MLQVDENIHIAETGYFRLRGTLTHPGGDVAVRACRRDTVLAAAAVGGDAGELAPWRLESFGDVRPEDGAVRLEVLRDGEVLASREEPLVQDRTVSQAIGLLRQNHDVRVFSPEDCTRTDNAAALAVLRRGPVPLVAQQLPQADLDAWIAEAAYAARHPAYVREFPAGGLLEAKASQHLLSARLCDLGPGARLLDTASSASPFWLIARERYALGQSLRHDWNFPAGLHGDTIGSDAGEIPLPSASLDAITSHCSFEHFEGDTDVRYLRECARLLRPGGVCVIVPLYFADRYAAHTSPHVWSRKYRATSTAPAFDATVAVYLREPIRQRLAKFFTAEALIERILVPFADEFAFSVHYYDNYEAVPGCPAFALRGVRRGGGAR